MGELLQANQGVLGVGKETLLDLKRGPGRSAEGGLPGCTALQGETGADVADRDCLDGPCHGTQGLGSVCHGQTWQKSKVHTSFTQVEDTHV